jgi:EmrB/QacA subfamily drug resistance transporter
VTQTSYAPPPVAAVPDSSPHLHPAGRRTPPRSRQTAGITLTVVCVTTMMLMLDIAVVNTALTAIAADLHTGLSGGQWVVDAYTLALAALVLTAGSLADRLGRRRVLNVGLALFTMGSFACAAADSTGLLILDRAVQGSGAAALFAVSLPLIGHAFPAAKDRAAALAIYGATIGGSFVVGPLVGGLLTEHLSWRWIFLVNVPVGLVCMGLTAAGVRESRDPHPRRVDWIGQLLMCCALFLLVFALLRGNADGWTTPRGILSLTVALVLLASFLVVESRVREPMLPLAMFANRAFTATQIAAFAISSSLFAVFLYLTLYLQGVLGLSPVEAGAAYLPGTVLMFVVSGATAQLLNRIRPGAALVGSLLTVGAGLALMVLAGPHSSWTVILPGFMLACIGTGVFNPVMSGLVLAESAGDRHGLATGINDSFRQTGIAVGIAGLGAFVPAGAAFGLDPAGYVGGLHRALWVACAIAVVGAAVSAVLFGRGERQAGSPE